LFLANAYYLCLFEPVVFCTFQVRCTGLAQHALELADDLGIVYLMRSFRHLAELIPARSRDNDIIQERNRQFAWIKVVYFAGAPETDTTH